MTFEPAEELREMVKDLDTNAEDVYQTKHNGTLSETRTTPSPRGGVAQHEKPLWKTMLLFLIPLMISNALQSIGQLVGSILLGRWIGVEALAAVSAFFPIFFLLLSFVIGIGSGSSILIGQAYGAQDEERIKAIIGTSLTFTFVIGLVLAIAGGIFTWDVLQMVGTPENVLATSVHFARVMFLSMPLLFLYFVYTTLMRGTGDSKTPLYFLILSTGLNLGFLPILIKGWLGLPVLGVNGSAYANLASTVLTFVIMVIYLNVKKHPLRIDKAALHHLMPRTQLVRQLLRLGIPGSVQMILVSLAEIAVITFVNHFGSNATAAYGAVNQVASYVQMPAISISISVSIFAAQMIGANRMDKLNQVVKTGLILNYAVGGILVVLVYLFSRDILSWSLTSQATLNIAHELLVITLWSYLIFGNAGIFTSVMRASGTVVWPTVFAVVSIWAVEVPVAYVFSHMTSLGIRGIWIGYPAAFVVNLGMQYVYYRRIWRRKRIARLAG
jgi:putative MATE family efflux protein